MLCCCGIRSQRSQGARSRRRPEQNNRGGVATDDDDDGTSYRKEEDYEDDDASDSDSGGEPPDRAPPAPERTGGGVAGDDDSEPLQAAAAILGSGFLNGGSCQVRRQVQAAMSTLEKDDRYVQKVRRAAARYQADGYYGDAVYCFALALGRESQPLAQADLLNSIGTAYRKTGKYQCALSAYDRGLRLLRAAPATAAAAAAADDIGAEPTPTATPKPTPLVAVERGAMVEVAKVLTNKGLTYKEMSLLEPSLQQFEAALELQRRFYGDDGGGCCDMARTLCHIGKAQSKLSRHDAALVSYETALVILKRAVGPAADHQDVALALGKLGNLYAATGQYDEALRFHKMALSMKSRLRVDPNDMASSLMDAGNVYYMTGRFRRALRYHFRSLKLKGSHRCRDLRALAASLGNIGYAYEGLGKCKTARKYFEKTLTLLTEFHDNPRHPDIIRTESNIARVKGAMQFSGAVKQCGDALLY